MLLRRRVRGGADWHRRDHMPSMRLDTGDFDLSRCSNWRPVGWIRACRGGLDAVLTAALAARLMTRTALATLVRDALWVLMTCRGNASSECNILGFNASAFVSGRFLSVSMVPNAYHLLRLVFPEIHVVPLDSEARLCCFSVGFAFPTATSSTTCSAAWLSTG